jgi:hypothetical protein
MDVCGMGGRGAPRFRFRLRGARCPVLHDYTIVGSHSIQLYDASSLARYVRTLTCRLIYVYHEHEPQLHTYVAGPDVSSHTVCKPSSRCALSGAWRSCGLSSASASASGLVLVCDPRRDARPWIVCEPRRDARRCRVPPLASGLTPLASSSSGSSSRAESCTDLSEPCLYMCTERVQCRQREEHTQCSAVSGGTKG